MLIPPFATVLFARRRPTQADVRDACKSRHTDGTIRNRIDHVTSAVAPRFAGSRSMFDIYGGGGAAAAAVVSYNCHRSRVLSLSTLSASGQAASSDAVSPPPPPPPPPNRMAEPRHDRFDKRSDKRCPKATLVKVNQRRIATK